MILQNFYRQRRIEVYPVTSKQPFLSYITILAALKAYSCFTAYKFNHIHFRLDPVLIS